MSKLIAILAVALALSMQAQVEAQAQQQQAVRMCIGRITGDKARCEAWFAQAMANANVTVTCVYRPNDFECMEAIKNNEADLVRGGGDLVFTAKVEYNFDAYLAEDYGLQSGTAYYGVAVVKKEMCDRRNNDVRLSDLKGMKMCTTGYRRTAGWTLPVGFMVTTGLMPVVTSEAGVQADAQSVASFFGTVCAPGTTNGPGNSAGPRREGNSVVGLPYDKLCTGCSAGGKSCNADSEYGDYEGALRCMAEGSGDVAFVRHSTPEDYERNQAGRPHWVAQTDLRLVCADNSGCAPTTAFDRSGCSYARAPAHAFVGRPNLAGGPAFAVAMAARSDDSSAAGATWLQSGKDQALLSSNVEKLVATRTGGAATNIVDFITPTSFSYFKTIRDMQAAAQQAQEQSGGGGDDGLSDGAIAGIVVGSVVGTALLAAIIAFFVIKRQKKSLWEQFAHTNNIDLNAKFNPQSAGSSPDKGRAVATSYTV